MNDTTDLDRDDATPLHCPKCKADMEKVTYQNIVVDRCTACRGLWFDALEKEHLAALKGSDVIDTGAPTKPAAGAPTKAKLNCPVCHTPMIDMVDQRHPHLHYESCTVCYGVFFDAGEFREAKEHTVLATFRDWFGRRG